MWRAMRLKENFTQKEIVKITGASRIHARKYFIQLKKQGLIEVMTGQGYEKGVFRLKDPAGAPLEYPKMLW
jgi:response regulator of citrate/malate metabolism